MKKKCKICKTVELYYRNGIPTSKYCKPCRLTKEMEKKEKHKLTKTYQKSRFKTLHKKAWSFISIYVRSQGVDEYGYNHCYSCEVRLPLRDLQCGHFFHNKLDFDLRNLKPQCSGCNLYKHGNLAPYGVKLSKELGVKGMEKLRLDSHTTSYSNEDLEKIILLYND